MKDDLRTRPEEPVTEEQPRHLPALAYPLLAVLFAGSLVWAFSRILLASSAHLAAAIAMLMALNILIGAALIAYGGRVRRRPATFPFLVVAGLALIAVGIVTMTQFGDRPPAEAAGDEGPKAETVSLVAQMEGTKFAFQQKELTFTAGANVTVQFDNKDAGVSHNFVLFGGQDATAPVIFRGDLVAGPKSASYAFKAPGPGTYFFHCDVHPADMNGTVTVTPPAPGGGPGPGGGPPGGAATLAAQNVAFVPAQLNASVSGGKVTIHFDNKDPVPHNVAIFNGPDASGDVIFRGDVVTGPKAVDYTFDAPPPGSYFFHCDVHPAQMTGTITIGGG
jgi:plastocyanin